MTEKEFSNSTILDKIGKKMPYNVPDGFFEAMADSISDQAAIRATERRPQRMMRWRTHILRISLTAAAVAAALITVVTIYPHSSAVQPQLTLEQAFNDLSAADQDYLIDNYLNDMIAYYSTSQQ